MKKTGKSCILFLFITLLSFASQATSALEVFATVDRNEMNVGDTFTYAINVSSEESLNLEEPRLPDLTGFELLNSWTSSQSQSTFANGRFEVKQTRSFNYMLAPTSTGKVRIGAAQVVVDGKVYNTKPIQLNILEGSAQAMPQAGGGGQVRDPREELEDVFNQLLERQMPGFRSQPVNPDEAFFIQVEVDKTEVYVGEQVTATWYLYTRGQIRDIDTLKYPSVNGFWKEDIELATQLNFQQEIVNGIPYKKALLASYALFPLKAGKAVVDSYKAKCTVVTPSNFGFGRPYQFTKASKPVDIKVKDIPTENRPENYSGAVGNFQVRTEIDQKTVPVNQPVTLKLIFEGEGNAKLIDLPPLSLPPSLELYDTQADSKFFRDGRSYKEFQLLVIPRSVGEHVFPSISVSAFDPKSGKFYTQTTPEITLTATPGEGDTSISSSPMAQGSKGSGSLPPVMPGLLMEWSEASVGGTRQSLIFWSFAYLLLVLGLGVKASKELGWLKGQRDVVKMMRPKLQRLNAYSDKGKWREVGTEGTNLIYFVLGEISGLGGASHEIDKLLLSSAPSVRRELGASIKSSLSYFETLSFAPEEAVGSLKSKESLKSRVKEVEKTLVKAVSLAEKREEKKSQGKA